MNIFEGILEGVKLIRCELDIEDVNVVREERKVKYFAGAGEIITTNINVPLDREKMYMDLKACKMLYRNLIEDYFKTNKIKLKSIYTKNKLSLRYKNDVCHIIDQKQTISFRLHKQSKHGYIICEDLIDVDYNAHAEEIMSKIEARWFWLAMDDLMESKFSTFDKSQLVNKKIYISSYVTTMLLKFLERWTYKHRNDMEVLFAKGFYMNKAISPFVKYTRGNAFEEAMAPINMYEAGHYQAPKRSILINILNATLNKLQLNLRETNIKMKQEDLNLEDTIIVYYSENNHTYDPNFGNGTFLFHAVHIVKGKVSELIKIPVELDVIKLFQGEFKAINYKENMWLEVTDELFGN